MDLKRLKRFDKDKLEQLEGLLQWCALLGLTGKDLISLGGHIDRIQAREVMLANMAIVDGMGCTPVGDDTNMHRRWRFKHANGTYRFEEIGWYCVKITNTRTKVVKKFTVKQDHDLGHMVSRKRLRYYTMLDVSNSTILLDF
jgi:hypothetical protein